MNSNERTILEAMLAVREANEALLRNSESTKNRSQNAE